MERTGLIPFAGQMADPRPAMDIATLELASRNAFPVVAQRPSRSDGLGLAAGGMAALLLGAMTFVWMSGTRQPRAIQPTMRAPVSNPAPLGRNRFPRASPWATDSTIPTYVDPTATPAAPADPSAIRRGWAPVLVFDTGTAAKPTDNSAPAVTDKAPSAPEGASRMANPSTTIVQGTLIPAVLETPIDSDLPGYARALVAQDVKSFDGSRVLIPRSSRLVGEYKSNLAAGQTRAYVQWTRLIRPDGASIPIASPATDASGQSGLAGKVNNHFLARFGSAMLLSLVGAATSVSNASMVISGSQSAATVAAQRDAQIPPTIRIRQGTPLSVFTARDLDFSSVETAAVDR